MENEIRDFTELEVWKKCQEIKMDIYNIVKVLPEEEKYNLASQMRRAAVSITANIAEGYGRFHYQENIQFCRQSRGSLYELKDHILTCFECRYIKNEEKEKMLEKITHAIIILNGYIKMLRNRKEADTNDE